MERILPAGAGGSRPASPPRRLATVAGAPAAPAATTTAATTHARAATFHATAWLDTLDLSFTDNDKTPRPAAATTALRIDPHSGDIDDDGDASGGDSPRVWSPNPLFTDPKNDHDDDDARAENTAVQTRGRRETDEAEAAAALAALLRCVLCVVRDTAATAAPPDEESPAAMTPAPPPPAWVQVRDVENNDDESLNPLLPQKSEEKARDNKHSCVCASTRRACANVAAAALALLLGVVVPIHSLITGTELAADGSNGLGVTRASVSMKLLILLASHWTLQVTLCAPKHGGLTHTTFLTDAFGGFAPRVHRRRVHAAYAQIVRSQTRKEW